MSHELVRYLATARTPWHDDASGGPSRRARPGLSAWMRTVRSRRRAQVGRVEATLARFSGVTGDELTRFRAHLTVMPVLAGKRLTAQGEPGREFFILCEGRVQVTVDGEAAAVLEAGECFGELALLPGFPGPARARRAGQCPRLS